MTTPAGDEVPGLSLHRLRGALIDYSRVAPELETFCGSLLREEPAFVSLPARDLPVLGRLAALGPLASPTTAALLQAIVEASPHVYWSQSYTLDDPGFDQRYLDNYGWFNVVAPSGPFVSRQLRVSVGYWGRGLHYPTHRHAPEELYLAVAGSALFFSEGRSTVEAGPGTIVRHFSNQAHSIRMTKGPLLAAVFWRGSGLEHRPDLRLR